MTFMDLFCLLYSIYYVFLFFLHTTPPITSLFTYFVSLLVYFLRCTDIYSQALFELTIFTCYVVVSEPVTR